MDKRMKVIRHVLELDTLAEDECLAAPTWEDPNDPLAHCILREELKQMAEMLYADGYDLAGFEIREIPHPEVMILYNKTTEQCFCLVKDGKTKIWGIGFHDKDNYLMMANSVSDAINEIASHPA